MEEIIDMATACGYESPKNPDPESGYRKAIEYLESIGII